MKASEAFDSVCGIIADKYKDDGWRYAKSKHWMTKKDKRFTYRVYFYTSWNNVSDLTVSFYGECAVEPLKSKDSIFHINNFRCGVPKGRIDWNIAKEKDWDKAVTEFTDWLNKTFIPVVENCTNNLDSYVRQVALEGFYPPEGYLVDIGFILEYGSRELAEEATKRYYDSLEENVKVKFKENYVSMINGNEAVSIYGENSMKNDINFRTIIENRIIVEL